MAVTDLMPVACKPSEYIRLGARYDPSWGRLEVNGKAVPRSIGLIRPVNTQTTSTHP